MTDHPDIVERLRDKSGKWINGLYDDEAAADITRLRAEAEALRKDAERYRWLRDPNNGKALSVMQAYGLEDAKELDDAIDAAIESRG